MPIELMLLIVPLFLTRISGLEPMKGSIHEWYSSPKSKFPLPMVKTRNIGIDNPPSIPSDQRQPEVDMKDVKFSPRYSQVNEAGGSASPHEVTVPPVTSPTITYARINSNVPYLRKNKVRGNYLSYPTLQYLPPGNIEGRMNVSASMNNSQSQSGWALQTLTPPTVIHNSVGNNLIRADDLCKLSDRSKCKNSNVKRQGGLTAISDIGDLGELGEIDNLSLLNMNKQHDKKMFICWINTKKYRIPLEIIVFILNFSNTCFSIPTSIGNMIFRSIGDSIMKFQDTTWIIVDNFKSLVKPLRRKLFFKLFPYLNRLRETVGPVKNGFKTSSGYAVKSNVGQTLSNSVRQDIPPISYMKNGKRTLIF